MQLCILCIETWHWPRLMECKWTKWKVQRELQHWWGNSLNGNWEIYSRHVIDLALTLIVHLHVRNRPSLCKFVDSKRAQFLPEKRKKKKQKSTLKFAPAIDTRPRVCFPNFKYSKYFHLFTINLTHYSFIFIYKYSKRFSRWFSLHKK